MRPLTWAAEKESRVPAVRQLVAVAKLAGRRSRNVRISCTFMSYHHKAPQHEHAQLASRIVVAPAHDTARGSARGQRRATDCSATRRSADGRGRGTHARWSPARLASCPYISSQYCLLQILSIKLLYNTGSSTGRSTSMISMSFPFKRFVPSLKAVARSRLLTFSRIDKSLCSVIEPLG